MWPLSYLSPAPVIYCKLISDSTDANPRMEAKMSKGQAKSNKEAKKPKADKKAKGPGSTYKQSQGKSGLTVDSSGRKT